MTNTANWQIIFNSQLTYSKILTLRKCLNSHLFQFWAVFSMNSQTLINDKKNLEPYDFLFSSEIKKKSNHNSKRCVCLSYANFVFVIKGKESKVCKVYLKIHVFFSPLIWIEIQMAMQYVFVFVLGMPLNNIARILRGNCAHRTYRSLL